MTDFAIYKIATGKIDRILSGNPDLLPLNVFEGEDGIHISATLTEVNAYVDNGQVVEKQPLNLPESLQITADGTDEAVITNIPAGVTVQWPDGQTDEVTDGEVRFAVDLPGTYTLIFDAVPYLRQEVTIEAVAAT
jgi:peptidoglycan hydrolase-like protein with peptidoglycan-binding domain